jgi:hypothetical protein
VRPLRPIALAALLAATSARAAAQTTSQPSVIVTGYGQAQYRRVESDGDATDRVFFRRLYLGVRFVLTDDWSGTLLVDVAPAADGDQPVVRDAYLRYSGWSARGVTLTIGNQKAPFSRSVLGSSRSRSLIERPFTGERGYGAPGRALAVQADGRHSDEHFQWAASLASVLHAPDADELRLDGLADAAGDWNEGVMATGRAEWHPRGAVAREQADFTRGNFRVMAGASAYVWTNDGDRNAFTAEGDSTSDSMADLDRARAIELSTAIRGHGLSLDAAWSRISGDTIDPDFDGGLYRRGHAVLHQFGTEGGYMVVPSRLEIIGALDALSADGLESTTYRRSVGTIWYMNGHRLKLTALHRETFNALGVRDARARATSAQVQFAF